MENNN